MKKLVLFIATMSLLALGACELFAPRKAQEPVEPVDWNTFFINPALTEDNLEYSYNHHQNALKYGDILSTNFTFRFAVQDINDYGTPVSWNAENEKEMLVNLHENLSNKNEKMELILEAISDQPDQINATNAWIYRKYTILIQSEAKEILTYEGRCALYLESDNGFWKIKEWNDYRTESAHSWGLLKYYQDNQDV